MGRSPLSDYSLRLFLLGGFRAERDGSLVPASAWLRRVAARTLVKLLAARPEHRIHREEALELLWPEVELDAALNRFGKALHAARRALEPDLPARSQSSYLHLVHDVLILDMDRVWIDVDHFESLVRTALPSDDLFALDTAVAAYGGELLPEDRYEDWAGPRRSALAELHTQTLRRRAALLDQQGEHERAAEDLRLIVTSDPLHEEAHRALMRLYARTGQRSQALRQYESCRIALRQELGTGPEQETEALHHQILNERAVSVPPPMIHAALDPSLLPAPVRQGPATPSVGRSRVFDILRADLGAAAQGQGRVVLLSGEAGVGKSRLAADLAREAAQRGVTVLWGSAHDHGHSAPYGPFVEAIEHHLIGSELSQRDELAARHPLLARLFPSLHAHHPGPSVDLTVEVMRARIFASFAALLADLAERGPLLLVLDDVHGADEASVELLQYLARMAPAHPWLLLGAYREEELTGTGPVPTLLSSLPRNELARRIELGRLARKDVDQLVHDLLPEAPDAAFLHRVYALSLGNPLFVRELVRAEREREAQDETGASGDVSLSEGRPIPHTVRQLVGARIGSLGPDARRVLTLAACIGTEWTYDDLHDAARIAFPRWFTAEALLEVLDRALDAQIIEDGVQRFWFHHPLFHAALLDETPTHWRSHLHAAVGAMIEQRRPGNVHEMAFHFRRSHEIEKTIFYLDKAGDGALLLHSYDLAAGYFHDLAVALERAGRSTECAVAREKLGTALSFSARYEEAARELGAAVESFRSVGDLEAMGRAAARLGRLHFRRGTPALGLAAIQPVLDSIEPAPPQHGGGLPRVEGTGSSPGQALRCLYAVQALLQGACGDYEGQKAAAERAGDMARSASDERVMALAEYARAAAALHLGDTEDARRALESTVVPLAESAGDLDTLSLAHTGLAFTYLADGALDESQRHLNAALESAVELGDPVYLAFAHYRLGVSAYLMGDAWEADHHFVQAAQLNHDVTAPWITPYVLAGFALVRALEHRSSEAINCLLQSREAAERTGDLAAHHTLRHILHLQQRHHLGSQESRTRVMAVFRQAGELLRDRIVA